MFDETRKLLGNCTKWSKSTVITRVRWAIFTDEFRTETLITCKEKYRDPKLYIQCPLFYLYTNIDCIENDYDCHILNDFLSWPDILILIQWKTKVIIIRKTCCLYLHGIFITAVLWCVFSLVLVLLWLLLFI